MSSTDVTDSKAVCVQGLAGSWPVRCCSAVKILLVDCAVRDAYPNTVAWVFGPGMAWTNRR